MARRKVRAGLVLFAGTFALACSNGGGGGSHPGTGGSTGSGGAGGATGTAGTAGTAGGAGQAGASGGAGTAGASGTGGGAGSGAAGGAGAGSGGAGAAGTGASGAGGGAGSAGKGGAGGAAGAGGAGGAVTCPTANEEKFSFFIVSNKALIREGGADASGMFSKLGGNLGGIKGADAICQHVAEFVSPCQRNKVWHAFLSTTTEDAVDRVGKGPWYDRAGRLWAGSLTTLVEDRPSDADAAIKNDAPNEDGLPNHNPEGTGTVDNHETLTGTGANGRLYTQVGAGGGGNSTQCGADVGATGGGWSAERATCWNWTRNTAEGCPRVGHTWCSSASCKPAGGGSGTNWMSVWNEGGCAPGGTLAQTGGLDGSRRVGSAGGYGGFFCLAVIPHP